MKNAPRAGISTELSRQLVSAMLRNGRAAVIAALCLAFPVGHVLSGELPVFEQTAQTRKQQTKCSGDIEIELQSGAVFQINRRIVSVYQRKDQGDFTKDCSIARVRGGSLYVYSNYALRMPDFDGPIMPRRFTLTGTYTCYGEPCPWTTYREHKAIIDRMLKGDEPHSVTATGFLKYEKLAIYVMPTDKYSAPSGEPLVAYCTPSQSLPSECNVAYRIDEKVVVSYWFEPSRIPEAEWLQMDQRMRSFVARLRKE